MDSTGIQMWDVQRVVISWEQRMQDTVTLSDPDSGTVDGWDFTNAVQLASRDNLALNWQLITLVCGASLWSNFD